MPSAPQETSSPKLKQSAVLIYGPTIVRSEKPGVVVNHVLFQINDLQRLIDFLGGT